MRLAFAVLLLFSSVDAEAQTWADLKSIPRETSVRVHELDGKGCSDSRCAAIGIPAYAAVGAIIDWRNPTKRSVYRRP
jgi:hypothetical protein